MTAARTTEPVTIAACPANPRLRVSTTATATQIVE